MHNRICRVSRVLAFELLACLLTLATSAGGSGGSEHSPLKKVADIPLPGSAVRFDYQSLDTSQGRLYIAHMNANQLVVFDTRKREVIANLDGFSSVHGVWAVPELGRVYASTTGEHSVAVVDMATLKTIAKVGPIKYPDASHTLPNPSESSCLTSTGTQMQSLTRKRTR